MSAEIDRLQLSPNARRAAEWVRRRYPDLRFTSGRRSLEDQARVMAQNTMRYGREWVKRTYRYSPAIAAIVDWLERAPHIVDYDGVRDGIYATLLAQSDADLLRVSRHLTGDAFDLAWPGDTLGPTIAQDVRENMPREFGLEKLIDREGGLRVLHLQFAPSVEV